jgi:xanthine dehydrogenase accessory factor
MPVKTKKIFLGGEALMNEYEYLAGVVYEQLENNSPVVLVSVVSLQGSTPRHNGAKMAVGDGGKNYGTIGGSLLEAAAISESRKVLSLGKSKFMHFDLNNNSVFSNGMICGGQADLLLEYIPVTVSNRKFFKSWQTAMTGSTDFFYLTQLQESGDSVKVTGHGLLSPGGEISGDCGLIGADLETLKEELHNISATAVLTLSKSQVIVDPVRKLKTVYCFGAGHVAVPTTHLASLVGFRVVVIDDRAEFANAARFPEATGILVIQDFNKALEGLDIDRDSFIVILTRGHQYDRVVLEQALKTSAGYIGMISSRKKREAIYNALMEAGVKKEALEQVHSPIGLAIGAETPEEIAVSIAAELINERDKQKAAGI